MPTDKIYSTCHFTSACIPAPSPILGEDAAEERHVGLELLREGVEARKGTEVHHAIGGLGTVQNRHVSSYMDKGIIVFKFLPINSNHIITLAMIFQGWRFKIISKEILFV